MQIFTNWFDQTLIFWTQGEENLNSLYVLHLFSIDAG